MSTLDALVSNALRDPLAAARAHAQAGGRVIGYFGAEIPVELILASGAFALRLPSAVTPACAAADLYLESSFMPESRSIAEQYLQGAFDFLQGIVLPRSNDSAQRLYYYLCELRGRGLSTGPTPTMYDLAKIPRESSKAHSRAATRRLAAELKSDMAALPAAITTRNRRRDLFTATAQLRAALAMRGSEADRICRAADFCAADDFDAAFSERLASTADSQAVSGVQGEPGLHGESGLHGVPRLVLAGSAPPDERLHRAVEDGGGNVIAEADAHAARAVAGPPIDPAASIDGVADHYYSLQDSTRAFSDRVAAIIAPVQQTNADGVIIWLVEEDDALIWDLPAQMSALAARPVAALALQRRRWDCGDGALAEIQAFVARLGGAT
jgi:benzoyl-CoA reductase/2-hydroxyglutaryl-CoA dehydratase subunit BcrC/BadD/HgdB